jgi:hypothetical protein
MRVRSWPLACPRGNSASMKPGGGSTSWLPADVLARSDTQQKILGNVDSCTFPPASLDFECFSEICRSSHRISIELAEINQQESDMASIHAPPAPTDFCLSRLTQCLPNGKFRRISIELVELPKQARSECPVTCDRIRYQLIPPSSDGTEPLEATLRLAATTFRP